MDSIETAHRLQFAFTITYHYIFPQLTMGLALLIVVLKTLALRTGSVLAADGVRFWSKIFGLNFVMGVVTGIPLEFQFGTNWSRFSEGTGSVIGQTLAMEGIFAFFLESAFLYALLTGEKWLSPRMHWVACVCVCIGSWLSGMFIVATNAWMQHPVGYHVGPAGEVVLDSFWALFTNPWFSWQYMHTMLGSVVTGSMVMAGVGALYLLLGRHVEQAKLFVRIGVISGFAAVCLVAFPSGHKQVENVIEHQPTAFVAMEGHFETASGAGMNIIGQPDMEALRLDNVIEVPQVLSLLTHRDRAAEVRGLVTYPRDQWPTNIPLLYYAYHIMVGLGTIFMATLGLSTLALWRRKLYQQRVLLWGLMLSVPLPFIANTAGWITAESGRQPWVVYGLMRTADGFSPGVSSGNVLFSLLGFMGLYALLSVLYLLLMTKLLIAGPGQPSKGEANHA